jgi:hypothetical protein
LRKKTAFKKDLKSRLIGAGALGRRLSRCDPGGTGLRLERETLIANDRDDLAASYLLPFTHHQARQSASDPRTCIAHIPAREDRRDCLEVWRRGALDCQFAGVLLRGRLGRLFGLTARAEH